MSTIVEVRPLVPATRERKKASRYAKPEKLVYQHLAWPYLMLIPVLYILGAYAMVKRMIYRLFKAKAKTNIWLVDGISQSSRAVRDGAATYRALDVVYNFKEGQGSSRLVRDIDWFWIHVRNAQAVWNRYRIVRSELCSAIQRRSFDYDKIPSEPIRILSIAAGSAQAVIEAMAEMKRQGYEVEALLLDASSKALAYAEELAAKHGLTDSVRTKKCLIVADVNGGDVYDFENKIGDFKPDIIEMAGLIDYLLDDQIIELFQRIYVLLPVGGTFITCHIHPNHESFFLLWVVNWWMRYRSKSQLEALLKRGWFEISSLITEPHRIHTVAVARRWR